MVWFCGSIPADSADSGRDGNHPTAGFRVIGNRFRSRKDKRRTTQVDVAAHVLNRMAGLARPISSTLHEPVQGEGCCAC